MKLILILLVSIGACLGVPKPQHLQLKNPVKIQDNTLLDEMEEFIDLFPLDDMISILNKHLENDPALSAIVDYLQSADWKNLLKTINDFPESKDLSTYLTDNGIPVEDLFSTVQETIDDLTPGIDPDISGSLRPLIDEEGAILPREEIVEFLNDKLQHDALMQDAYITIASEKIRGLVLQVLDLDEVQYIDSILRGFGIDIDGIRKEYFYLFGWGEPPTPVGKTSKKINFEPKSPQKVAKESYPIDLLDILSKLLKLVPYDDINFLLNAVAAFPGAQGLFEELAPIIVELMGDGGDKNQNLQTYLKEKEGSLHLDKVVSFVVNKHANDPKFQEFYNTISAEKAQVWLVKLLAWKKSKQ